MLAGMGVFVLTLDDALIPAVSVLETYGHERPYLFGSGAGWIGVRRHHRREAATGARGGGWCSMKAAIGRSYVITGNALRDLSSTGFDDCASSLRVLSKDTGCSAVTPTITASA